MFKHLLYIAANKTTQALFINLADVLYIIGVPSIPPV